MTRGGAPQRMLRAALASVALLTSIALALAVAAQAQTEDLTVPDPCSTANQTAADSCNNEYAPQPNGGAELGWQRIAGAGFGAQEADGSPTRIADDFFATAFRSTTEGFFAGAECKDPGTPFAQLESCERVPVIYSYSVPPGQKPEISQVYGPAHSGSEDEPGFVSAVAWIGPGKAIAVGGTGHYPRRELPWCRKVEGDDPAAEAVRCQEATEADYAARDLAGEEPNAAGEARAWLYSDGRWRELDELPDAAPGQPMAALTAVDCSPRPASDGELCIAGGMRQIWTFRESQFARGYTPTSLDDQGNPTVIGKSWRFRVRSLRFMPGDAVPVGYPDAYAVTSGCCAETADGNAPRQLTFDGQRWTSRLLVNDMAFDNSTEPAAQHQSLPDSYYGLAINVRTCPGCDPLETVLATPGDPRADPRQPHFGEPASRLIAASAARNDQATIFGGTTLVGLSACGATGNNDSASSDPTGHLCAELLNPNLTDVRLHGLGGDFSGTAHLTTRQPQPDGVSDWAVGQLNSTGEGIAYTITKKAPPAPNVVTCQGTLASDLYPNPHPDTTCGPHEAAAIQADTQSQSLYSTGTYALNALADTPSGELSFAVGDKGGIARLGGEGAAASEKSEPAPARVGSSSPTSLPDDQAYSASQPGSGGPSGPIPSLAERPVTKLESPRLIPGGAPDPTRLMGKTPNLDVSSIVMSRDGSEGWAIGPGASRDAPGALFHFTGDRWSRCEMDGVPRLVPADPACASLARLQRNLDPSGTRAPTQLVSATRVPLERDSEPTNDDEFEAIAVGTSYTLADGLARAAVLRYRDGRWSVDEGAMKQIDPAGAAGLNPRSVAFTGPNDGWIVAIDNIKANASLFHFDGTRWIACKAEPGPCGNPRAQPAGGDVNEETVALVAVGGRTYYGWSETDNGDLATFIYSIDASEPAPQWTAGFTAGGSSADQGSVYSLAVTQDAGGSYQGWAVGAFGPSSAVGNAAKSFADTSAVTGTQTALLRLDPGAQKWRTYPAHVPDEYLGPISGHPPRVLSWIGPDGAEQAQLTPAHHPVIPQGDPGADHPMLSWRAGEEWRVAEAPFQVESTNGFRAYAGTAAPRAAAPDGQGGYWLAVRQNSALPLLYQNTIFFYHYTDLAPEQVFEDAPHPIREPITGSSPGPGGELWVSTTSNAVYRYDRVTGWDRVAIRGWDAGRVITRPSAANAIAVNSSGDGVVVGEGGRIADISPSGVRLDPAAGAAAVCSAEAAPPCGTGRNLVSAAVAPDGGAAMVGGEGRGLLWRPSAAEPFQGIPKPPASVGATFTGISMPSAARVYIATDGGQLFRGDGPGPSWSWTLEDVDLGNDLVTRSASGSGIPLRAIALDSSGRGYAVGDRGLVIERTGDGDQPWKRLSSGVLEDLSSVALPQSGGPGALIGGQLGLILTLRDGRFGVARTDDFSNPLTSASNVENTARIVGLAIQPGVGSGRVEAWAASNVAGNAGNARSPGPSAILHYADATSEPLLAAGAGRLEPLPDTPPSDEDELSFGAFGRSECHADNRWCVEPGLTNYTRDVVLRRIVEELGNGGAASGGREVALFNGDVDGTANSAPLSFERWIDFVRGPLAAANVPLFGALGAQDLTGHRNCDPVTASCINTGAGVSDAWRSAFAGMPAPWGSGPVASSAGLGFDPVPGSGTELPNGGAHTHYAVDIKDAASGAKLARLVVLDSSNRSSVSASDPDQNPVETQQTWLGQVLCREGSAEDTDQHPCSRAPGERAVVLTNTPLYSYGPGALTDTDTADSTQLEQTFFSEGVDAVISGRLGWNGLAWALAPGVHTPEAGGQAPDSSSPPDPLPGQAKPIPYLIASGAGGKFGPNIDNETQGTAAEGYWHGYSLLRLDPETGRVVVEQRPVFDWLAIRPAPGVQATHSVRAGKKLALEGFGREAAGIDTPLRYDEITTPAITHRYDLLVADPAKPWLAKEGTTPDNCDPYDCLSSNVATINGQSGEVRAGKGSYPRTFAIAALSAGVQSATYPLVFVPRASYRVQPPAPAAPVAVPPPPPPPAPAQPTTPQVNLPAAPVIPVLTAQALAPPPVPPSPPTFASEAPLDLNISPAALDVTPPTAVSQPPTPPVNPAPPGGARKEARQRQAAAQKSGADSDQESSEAQELGGDTAEAPHGPGHAATRHDFTAIAAREQPSAWARDALLGGGLGIAALLLALGASTARPTPRRREPELPAPAYARNRRR